LVEDSKASVETKTQLLEEKQRIDETAKRYIRRQAMYRRFILIIPFQFVLLIPYTVIMVYISSPRVYNGSFWWMILITIAYVFGFYLLFVREMRKRIRSLSKTICLYCSVSAAESLESGNIVKGSFFAVRLFDLIKPFSEAERIKLGHFKCTLKNLFIGDIENLHEQKSAIGKAILANPEKRNEFSNNLYALAGSLFSSSPSNIDGAIKALRFFDDASKKYFEPKTFLQNHKKLDSTTKGLFEIGKITLVPILLFVLWIVFGYK
jgi:hypothetical protein